LLEKQNIYRFSLEGLETSSFPEKRKVSEKQKQKTIFFMEFSKRLTATESYKFGVIKEAKRAALAKFPGAWLIDMGVGEPDEMSDPRVVERLREESLKAENRGYADNGCRGFLLAVSQYMERMFGVKLDPDKEILHSVGMKPALGILACCLVDPGDVVLETTPCYPVFGVQSRYYGGEIYKLPLLAENDFLPDLEAIPASILERTKVLSLNYPNNPTGAVATREFFEKVIWLAKKHDFVVIQDAAYASLTFQGKPLSILQTPGAKDVAVELHSLSKAFNMTGWRLGWVCGNEAIVNAFGRVKNHTDSGQFLAIQKAGITALEHPEIARKMAEKYERRMMALVDVLRRVGFRNVKMPGAGFFLYVEAPKGAQSKANGETFAFNDAAAVSRWLIENALIATVPWDDVGAFVRFSVTFDTTSVPGGETALLAELEERLAMWTFRF
jgi:LL-diaminopimelate aminotransferase